MNMLEEGPELKLDFRKLEKAVAGSPGILPVAIQNADTNEVILVAYTNDLAFRKSIELKPAQSFTHTGLGLTLLSEGKRDAALAEMSHESEDGWRLEGLAIANHALGKHAESDAALAELTTKYAKDAQRAQRFFLTRILPQSSI